MQTPGVAESGGGIISHVKWRFRNRFPLAIDSLSVVDGRYLETQRRDRCRLFALLRVQVSDSVEDPRLDYSAAVRITLKHQRVKGLLDGLHRARIPFIYTMMVKPSDDDRGDESWVGPVGPEGGPPDNRIFEFDLVIGTWMDVRGPREMQSAIIQLEQHSSTLAATISVGVPNCTVNRLTRDELARFGQNLLLPFEPRLKQIGDAAAITNLETFEGSAPAVVASARLAAEFYVPNAAETGSGGITIGRVMTRSGPAHQFKLQIEDLKRHTTLLGMTGAGKSTTASVIVRQVASTGLPVMILDWHNEHAELVRSVGGEVVSPGKDAFAINPMDTAADSEQTEHIEMITDIFSDTYHFTHPQAYMFRGALQRCLEESTELEVPTLASLVRIIEAYPLRSAYDNETKVAILRRIVPLTEGHVGRAFNSPSSHRIEDLLGKVVCVELGHIRDIQSRTIFADILLKLIYETKVAKRSGLEHLILVEEARNIVPARRDADPPTVGERMVSELRKFGEAMLFVAQFPSQIASEVIKNSGARIIHRVAWVEDLRLIGDSLNLTREQLAHVSTLGVGETVVSMSRIQRPVLVQVEPGEASSSREGYDRSDLNLVEEG